MPFDFPPDISADYQKLRQQLVMHRVQLIVVWCALLAVLVATFTWQHYQDKHHAAELQVLHDSISKDSVIRVLAVKKTDSAVKVSDSLTKISRSITTKYRTHTDSIPVYLDKILHDTVTDSVKVVELANQIMKDKGQSDVTVAACSDALNSCEIAKAKFQIERSTWSTEEGNLRKALSTAEKLNRHWGLGSTCGPAAVKVGSDWKGGLGCTVGITYRW